MKYKTKTSKQKDQPNKKISKNSDDTDASNIRKIKLIITFKMHWSMNISQTLVSHSSTQELSAFYVPSTSLVINYNRIKSLLSCNNKSVNKHCYHMLQVTGGKFQSKMKNKSIRRKTRLKLFSLPFPPLSCETLFYKMGRTG